MVKEIERFVPKQWWSFLWITRKNNGEITLKDAKSNEVFLIKENPEKTSEVIILNEKGEKLFANRFSVKIELLSKNMKDVTEQLFFYSGDLEILVINLK